MKDERFTLVENSKVVKYESKLVEFLSKYFGNVVQNLGIDVLINISCIKLIRENIDTTKNLSFGVINPECISKITHNLDTSKATQ